MERGSNSKASANANSAATIFPLQLKSVDDILREGREKLDDKVSSVVEKALQQEIYSLSIRFEGVNVQAELKVDTHGSQEIPTVWTTAKDALTGCFRRSETRTKHILKDMNGIFLPGEMNLILGQPGSGKSSLLKLLSGRFPKDKNVQVQGNITYNDIPQEDILTKLPRCISYVDQYDNHIPSLTVMETFQFSHFCTNGKDISTWVKNLLRQGNDVDYQTAIQMVDAVHSFIPELTVRRLGLLECQETILGDEMQRGVSGGERKRATIGEMSIGITFGTLMDEISTGLDSAATFDVIKSIQSTSRKFNRTVAMSLLQPPPEVFDLFDNVILLSEGEMLYQGPKHEIIPYFESLGYVCPEEKDIAYFLLELGTPQGVQFIRKGFLNAPKTSAQFAERYRSSSLYEDVLRRVRSEFIPENKKTETMAIIESRGTFEQSYLQSTMNLIHRQFLVAIRNKAFILGRCFMVVVMGFLFGSTYYNIDEADAQVVLGFLFSVVMFIALGQAAQIPTFMNERAVFYKQRGGNFFRTSSFVIATYVNQFPFALIEGIVFGSLTYWTAGLAPGATEFLVYIFILTFVNLTLSSYFFLIVSGSENLNIAQPIANVSVLIFVIFGGFIVTKDTIPDYFIWIYWLNPLSWTIRTTAVNQYRHADFDSCVYKEIDYCLISNGSATTFGEFALNSYAIPNEKEWIPYGLLYLLAAFVGFLTLSVLFLEYYRYESTTGRVTGDKTDENHQVDDPNQDKGSALSHEEREQGRNSSPTHVYSSMPSTPAPESDIRERSKGDEKIRLLKDISGFALPQTMTALMGASGAGKTTLMDVIAGRKTGGSTEGEILLNGFPATSLAISRSTGYCEQMDIHSEASTVREALMFSAFLRQSSTRPDLQKRESVQECIELLELESIANSMIRGMSTEQRKRLSIGVELASQPSILFLDEPTSGLDARSAKIIMNGVRNVANSGRTIVCTIHQPSTEVFELFDQLLLLKRGGECVYFGELGKDSRSMMEYFQQIPGTPAIPEGYNPATWMLEVIGAGVGDDREVNDANYVQCFKESVQSDNLSHSLEEEGLGRPAVGSKELSFEKKRASSFHTQLRVVLGRFFTLYWRTPSFNFTRYVLQIILALLFGLIYLDTDYSTFTGLNSGIGMVFLTTVFLGIVAFNSSLPVISECRTGLYFCIDENICQVLNSVFLAVVYYRERASQTYSTLAYFLASTIVEIPYIYSATLLFTVMYYPMVGFSGVGNMIWYWVNLSNFVFIEISLGQFLIFVTPTMEVGAIMGALINSIFFLYMGFNPPESAIPKGYKWLYYLCVPRYTLSSLVATTFSDCTNGSEIGCQRVKGAIPPYVGNTVQQYVEGNFNILYEERWIYFFSSLVFIAGLRVFTFLAMRFVNHQKK